MSVPSGMRTLRLRRLLWRAPTISRQWRVGMRKCGMRIADAHGSVSAFAFRIAAFPHSALPTPASLAVLPIRRHRNRFLAAEIRSGDRSRAIWRLPPACRGRRFRRRIRRRRGRNRAVDRQRRSLRDRARRSTACCPDREVFPAPSAAGGCRADAVRLSARPAHTARRTSPLPTWLASRIRCASPPESVGAGRRE